MAIRTWFIVAALLPVGCGSDGSDRSTPPDGSQDAATPAATAVDRVTLELVTAEAGSLGGSCPSAFVRVAIQVTNDSDAPRSVAVSRVFFRKEKEVARDLPLETDAGWFDGDVAPGSSVTLFGYTEYYDYSTICDFECTWHAEVEVLVDGKPQRLVGPEQTGIFSHTECYSRADLVVSFAVRNRTSQPVYVADSWGSLAPWRLRSAGAALQTPETNAECWGTDRYSYYPYMWRLEPGGERRFNWHGQVSTEGCESAPASGLGVLLFSIPYTTAPPCDDPTEWKRPDHLYCKAGCNGTESTSADFATCAGAAAKALTATFDLDKLDHDGFFQTVVVNVQ